MSLLLQPFTRQNAHDNFAQTVAREINLRDIAERHEVPVDLTEFLRVHQEGRARVWALTDTPHGRGAWRRLTVGELVLFIGSGTCYAYGTVSAKIHWPANNVVWPNESVRDWIYSLQDVRLIAEADRPSYEQLASVIHRFNYRPALHRHLAPLQMTTLASLLGLDRGPASPDNLASTDPITVELPSIPEKTRGNLAPSPEILPQLEDDDAALDPDLAGRRNGASPAQRRLDRLAEARAIDIAVKSLEHAGWDLKADRQADGCGYDLVFVRADDELHVEVKGIQGVRLVFNLTAKEWQRALYDPDFVVLAVTQVLSESPQIRAIGREELVAARRAPLAYRVKLDASP